MNFLPPQMLHQPRVLDASRSVPDALRVEQPQRLPHALRPACLARMRRAQQSVFTSEPIRPDMRVERKARLIAGNIERYHAAAAKLLNKPRSLHALLLRKMAQRAQNQPSLNARCAR